MIQLDIREAASDLSTYLDLVVAGEVVVLCRDGVPIAEIRAKPPARTTPRVVGPLKGQFEVPAAFFEALPEEVLDAFEGGVP